MKKTLSFIIGIILVFLLVACTTNEDQNIPPIEDVFYTVTFNANNDTTNVSQKVKKGLLAILPDEPTKEGYIFMYWYSVNENEDYDFQTPVIEDITLYAKWDKEIEPDLDPTTEDLIMEDMNEVIKNFYISKNQVSTPIRGPINKSSITWTTESKYVSTAGVILPLLQGSQEETNVVLKARFRLSGVTLYHEFEIELEESLEPVINKVVEVPFENLTDEYNVKDGVLELLFEEDGFVPYVRVADFFELLDGFIDPNVNLNYTTAENTLTVQYDYYDEEQNHTYDLNLVIDSVENTLTTVDPGFYWAYVYSTATNYGRNINYDRERSESISEGDSSVVYDLDLYNLDVVMYGNDVVIPFYIANQLFAGSSYYNVYYNSEALYGIYSLPGSEEESYQIMKTTAVNGKNMPADLVIHNFNFLAFVMNNFYGLQDIMNVEDYYDLLFTYKDSLLNTSADSFETGLFNFIVKGLDEAHTYYGYPGYYNKLSNNGPQVTSINQFGPRMKSRYMDGIYATDDAIAAKWDIPSSNNWSASSPLRPNYWFIDIDKTSVVLTLDNFVTSDIKEDDSWNDQIVNEFLKTEGIDFTDVLNGTKYFYYNQSTKVNDMVEVLIKGLGSVDVHTYFSALENNGFEKLNNSSIYIKEVNGKTLATTARYDVKYDAVIVSFDFMQNLTEKLEFTTDAFDLIYNDSAVYMEFMFDLILKETNNLVNVVLDITWNGGGNVGALYRVVGFITDEAFEVSSIDGDTNSKSTSYVYITDTPNYKHLNWALLTTPVSFSAANSLATIFQDNDFGPIIGSKTGGGASSITPVLLPTGSAFVISSNNISAYRTGDGTEESPYVYHSNEFGIEPTDLVTVNKVYDNATLMEILNKYSN